MITSCESQCCFCYSRPRQLLHTAGRRRLAQLLRGQARRQQNRVPQRIKLRRATQRQAIQEFTQRHLMQHRRIQGRSHMQCHRMQRRAANTRRRAGTGPRRVGIRRWEATLQRVANTRRRVDNRRQPDTQQLRSGRVPARRGVLPERRTSRRTSTLSSKRRRTAALPDSSGLRAWIRRYTGSRAAKPPGISRVASTTQVYPLSRTLERLPLYECGQKPRGAERLKGYRRTKEKADHVSMIGLYLCRQRPTLPHTWRVQYHRPCGA